MPELHKNPTVEDDLDDDFLDGALDGFTAAKPATPIKPTSTKKAEGAKSPKTDNSARTPEALLLNPELNEDDDDDDIDVSTDAEFQKSMAMGMEELMREMSSNSELQKTFEEMFKGMDQDLENKGSVPTEGSPIRAKTTEAAGSFQDRIAKTMDKLKDSSEQVEAQVTQDSEEALMAEMMKQMEGMAEGGDFQNVLEGMMEQLMSKDILYEPMLDLQQKYPQWLQDNKGEISESEYARYEKQYGYVKDIVAFFDKPEFDDKSDTQAKSVIELMQNMQDCGQPPADILDELAPGLEMGADGVPKMPDMPECNMQ
ncbi:Peroxisome chaperone and import receptor [Podila verticillata]|nr:Peroxisome chaperone and import receptor [Podila verticillata]